MEGMETTTTKRTGGRSAAVAASVKSAVEDLVRERGRERVTVPMIAERAGVNATSIYRRWGDLPALINDLATYKLDPNRPLPKTGDLQGDLLAWAQEIVDHYSNPVNASLLRTGLAAAGERESDCLRNRRAEAAELIAQATTGIDNVTVDLVADHLVAPIIYRVILSPWTLDGTLAPRLVDELLELASARRS